MRFLASVALAVLACSANAQVFIPVSVTFPPLPNLELGNDTNTAAGVPVQLHATVTSGTPPFTFLWTPTTAVSNPGLQNPVIQIDSTTTLTCTVIDANGCQSSDDIIVTVVPTGVPENLSKHIRVHPNPSDGRININGLEFLHTDVSIKVYDITGRQIFHEPRCAGSSTFILNLSAPGLYSLHILGGDTQIIHKFIIVK